MIAVTNNKPLRESLQEYGRGIVGGLLFSFPLLYTMEVWWAGFIVSPLSLLILITLTFFLLLGYNRFAGMHPDATWREILIDSVEELGLGIILSFTFLFMLNRIQPGSMSLNEIMGKIIIEAMFVSIGFSVGTAQLGAESEEEEALDEHVTRKSKVAIATLALCGSILVGGNVAPTEEIVMIAIEAKPVQILLMAMVSLLLTVIIIFFINFRGSFKRDAENLKYHVMFESCICYLIALSASAFSLWFFGRFENMSFGCAFSEVIVLGLLSSLGASAGRLLIK